MRYFLSALLLPFLVQLGSMIWSHGIRYHVLRPAEYAALVILLVLAPLTCAWFSAALVQLRRPRRMLLRRWPQRIRATVCGLIAGCASWTLVALGTHYLADRISGVLRDGLSGRFFGRDSSAAAPSSVERIASLSGAVPTDQIADLLLVCVAVTICTVSMVWLMPTRRPGLCVKCRYDIRASLAYERCPECGTPITM